MKLSRRLAPWVCVACLLSGGLALGGCSDSKTANDAKPCVTSSLDTAGEAAKTGGTTAVDGITTFGDSVGGFFSGGTDEAKRRWKEGGAQTKSTAKTGGAATKASAEQNECD